MNATEWINSVRPLVEFIEDHGGQIFEYEIEKGPVCGFFMHDPLCEVPSCIGDERLIKAAVCMWVMEVYWGAAKNSIITDEQYPRPNYAGQEPCDWLLDLLTSICEKLGYVKENNDD